MFRFLLPTFLLAGLLGCQLEPASSYAEDLACVSDSVLIHTESAAAEEILEVALAYDRGTGISAAVVIDGELVFASAVGSAEKRFPLRAFAPMRTGSVAKLFTSVAVARLVEMDRINLDDPIVDLVPETPDVGITPFYLGTHTSGIRHYNFNKLSEANNRTHYESLTDALNIFIDDPLRSVPGDEFHYSSFGFNLLGVVVERAYGTDYDDALNELVAEPFRLSSLAIDEAGVVLPCQPDFSTIAFGRKRIAAPRRDNSDLYPSGGLLVSAPDLASFVYAVFNSEFLQPSTIELFLQETITPDGSQTGYTFGWQIEKDEDGSVEWYGHGGQINGAYASVRYYPELNMAIAGMTNYNYWLTSKRPEFFAVIREEFPGLFR